MKKFIIIVVIFIAAAIPLTLYSIQEYSSIRHAADLAKRYGVAIDESHISDLLTAGEMRVFLGLVKKNNELLEQQNELLKEIREELRGNDKRS